MEKDNVTITLTSWEMMIAAQVGCMRHIQNLANGLKNAYNLSGWNVHEWQINIEGALGEYALAKHLNLHWSGEGIHAPDVFDRYQARTRSRLDFDLFVHPKDPDDHIYVLLCGKNGTYFLRGWLYGHEAKQKEYWSDPSRAGRPAFFVPQHKLRPIQTLPRPEIAPAPAP